MLVIGAERRLDAEMAGQLGGDARILAQDMVRALQHLDGAQGHVPEVADGRGRDIEARRQPAGTLFFVFFAVVPHFRPLGKIDALMVNIH